MELSCCGWKAIRQYFEVCSPEETLPAAILSIQTGRRFSQLESTSSCVGCPATFRGDGSLLPAALFQENILRELFEANVYKLLVSKGLVVGELISKMRSWRHSGFHVYVGPTITQKEDAVQVNTGRRC